MYRTTAPVHCAKVNTSRPATGTIDAICSEGGQTFTVFLTPGKDELALKVRALRAVHVG